MLLLLLLLSTPQPSLSGKNELKNKTECVFRKPITPYFSSRDLENNLTWIPPENSAGLRYTVRYKEYGSKHWQNKLQCTNITLTWCDLTLETNGTGQYFGKVFINNKTCTQSFKTARFYPLFDTEISPPSINMLPGNSSFEIKLTHPIKLLHDKFKGLKYRIYWNGNFQEIEEPYYMIQNINPNTKYCVTAEIYWLQKKSSLSEEACFTTSRDLTSEQTIAGLMYIVPIIFIFFTLTALGCATHKYIQGDNLKQPRILNITTCNINNAILLDAHTATINLITIESGKCNLQDIMVPSKEEDKEFKNQNNLHIIDGEEHVTCESGVTEEVCEESKDDHGYVTLQEPVTTPRPIISPYDMPHHPHEPIIPLSTSTDTVCDERDLYEQIKGTSNLSLVQGNDDLDYMPNGYTSEKTIVNYPYIPKGDSNFSSIGNLKEDPYEAKDYFMGQELDRINVIEDTGLNESSMLFLDWSPDNPSLYIKNLSRIKELENCIKQCQEEKDDLLPQLYIPSEMQETSDELGQLEERWGLLIQDADK